MDYIVGEPAKNVASSSGCKITANDLISHLQSLKNEPSHLLK